MKKNKDIHAVRLSPLSGTHCTSSSKVALTDCLMPYLEPTYLLI